MLCSWIPAHLAFWLSIPKSPRWLHAVDGLPSAEALAGTSSCRRSSYSLGVMFRRLKNYEMRRAASISYVPPVREQIAALSAEEVLVRASDPPTATPMELPRAAHEATQTAAEELLRPN